MLQLQYILGVLYNWTVWILHYNNCLSRPLLISLFFYWKFILHSFETLLYFKIYFNLASASIHNKLMFIFILYISHIFLILNTVIVMLKFPHHGTN